MMRNDKILSRIARSMKVIEIGPGYSPVLTREQNWNAFSLDHTTAEDLREKYSGHANVDISRIQEVDFVWRDGPLETAIPDDHLGSFDACIGSHMIEHVPDLVAFFQSMERILKPSGVVSLVVPDKRFCFDFFQPISMTGDVLVAHRERRTRHTREAKFNATAYMVQAGGHISWGQKPTGALSFYDGDMGKAGRELFAESDDAVYQDIHGWYFTYSSFRLLMLELAWLGHLNFIEVETHNTTHCEFFITLGQGRLGLTEAQFRARRMDLLTNMLLEVRDQADLMVRGQSYVGRI
jgi:SAM-dependent methyltransferase